MSALERQERYFSGQEILVEDISFDQTARINTDQVVLSDFWTDGILKDPNGLSNMAVTIDATTQTWINVSQGMAYSNGYRIAIDQDKTFDPNAMVFTTNGICTPQSSGNRAIPLANYTLNQPNYVWATYQQVLGAGRQTISTIDGSIHFPQEYNGYRVAVTTVNPPGNTIGLTNAVYLATVFGQGPGVNLVGSPTGITDLSRAFTNIKPLLNLKASITNGSIRGSTTNSGAQQEILQGTISTPDLRASAVTPAKIDSTLDYTVHNLTANGIVTTPEVDVIGDGSARHKITTASSTCYIEVGATASNDSRADLRFTSMNAITTFMTIQGSTGRVGIGTSSPGVTLDVAGVIQTSTAFYAPNGVAALPSVSFTNDHLSGMFLAAVSSVSLVSGGTVYMNLASSAITPNVDLGIAIGSNILRYATVYSQYYYGTIQAINGSAGNPSISFSSDPHSGMFTGGVSDLRFSAGGTTYLTLASSVAAFAQVATFALAVTFSSTIAVTGGATFSSTVNIPNTGLQVAGNQVLPVVQIVAGSTTTRTTSTSSSYVDTSLSVTVTPKFSSSKIWIVAVGSLKWSISGNTGGEATISDGATPLLTPGAIALTGEFKPVTMVFATNPGNTVAHTYKVQIKSAGGNTVTWGNDNTDATEAMLQYIIAIEFAQ